MFELYGIGAVALCGAVLKVAEKMGLPEKFSPVVACSFGIIEGLVVYGQEDLLQGVVLGFAAGLSTLGLLSQLQK